LLSKWPTPCDYAARANPDGAKFSFAFSLVDLYAIIRWTPLCYPVSRS